MMDETQARTFRAAYGGAVTRYTRMTKAALRTEWWALMADAGMEHLYGTMSKDELLSAVLNLRGYTIAKVNEASHVLGHQETPWPDCGHCAPMFVPSGTGWPVK